MPNKALIVLLCAIGLCAATQENETIEIAKSATEESAAQHKPNDKKSGDSFVDLNATSKFDEYHENLLRYEREYNELVRQRRKEYYMRLGDRRFLSE
ncbi:MAG: hypothetical protein LBN32_03755 [Helicobacteraceae bacterium]|jgi:hypothetical protein|nr:hypothetical protein [Helicobacteraceae bacterium]